jgi:quinolinate synthase
MNRISARNLAWVLDDLTQGKPLRNPITVQPEIAAKATKALDRMLSIV